MTPRPPRPSLLWFLPFVFLLAAVLRFHNLGERGFLYWDEGKFALEGIRLHHLGLSLAGKTVGTAKPTHALLIAAAYSLLGVHDYAPLFMNAFASTLQVLLAYVLARRLFDARTAILAALFLAVSEYDVIYARSALSESDANVFLTAGVLIWLLAWRPGSSSRWLPSGRGWQARVGAGLLVGLGFTVNYRLLVYIAVLVGIDLVMVVRVPSPPDPLSHFRGSKRSYRGPKRSFGDPLGWDPLRRRGGEGGGRMQCWLTRAAAASKALAAWGAGLVIFPVLWEAVGLLAQSHGYVLFRSEITYRITSYFSEVLYQLHGGKQGRMLFDPVIYLEWYAVREGVLMMVLIAGGLALAAVRRSFSWLMPAAMILVPYALYTFAPFIVPRNLDPTVPFATLLAAAALVAAADRITGRVPRLSLLLAAAAGVSLLAAALSWRLGEERSGFVFAADYLHQHGMSRAVVSNENMLYYLRLSDSRCAAAFLHKDLSLLSTARKAGISFAVADVYDTPAKRFLLHHGHRVARYLALGTRDLGENPIASDNGWPPGGRVNQHVDVYRLARLALPRAQPTARLTCSLDRLA